jgi:riboflavin kinase/FMN adenylyltransferase
MKILQNLLEIEKWDNRAADVGVTIGNFDGVHRGHRQLLKKIKQECLEKKIKFALVTFLPHPQKILNPEREHYLINSYEVRRDLLASLGVDYLIEIGFTRDFSTLSPEQFLQLYLLSYPQLKKIYLGYDFAFGANKQGGLELVQQLCLPRSIEVELQPKFEWQDQVVSSSLIRQLVSKGEMSQVTDLLQRPFHLEGFVVKGEGRGKKIGFPTANIQMAQDLIVPECGVYVTRTRHKELIYNSVTNIGHNPTFNESHLIHVETHLFQFGQDIYGEKLTIEFFHKIRDERKFPTVNDLIFQIEQDANFAKTYLKKL